MTNTPTDSSTEPEPVPVDAIAEVIHAARQAKQNAKDWTEAAKHLCDQIKTLMLDKGIEVGTIEEKPAVSVVRPKPRKSFRSKDFQRDYPELYAQYCDEEPSTPRLVFDGDL